MSTERYLVTGGCGLQGSHIVSAILTVHQGAPVHILSRNPTKNIFPGATYHSGDITSSSDVSRVLGEVKPTVVFHCAAALTIGRGATDYAVPSDEEVRRGNVEGTRVLLDACGKEGSGVKGFVFTSSAGVVQRSGFRDIVNADETWETVQKGDGAPIYQTTKAEAERLVLAANLSGPGKLKTCAIRPAAIYGERDNDLLPGILRVLATGRTGFQAGPNTALFATTYAGNSADAHLLAAGRLVAEYDGANEAREGEGEEETRVGGEAFFVTNGVDMPFFTFCRTVWAAAGDTTKTEDVKVVPLPLAVAFVWAGEMVAKVRGVKPAATVDGLRFTNMTRYYDISKAKTRLGYEPRVPWDEGVRRGVQWFLDQQKEREAKKPATAVSAPAEGAAAAS